MFISKYFKQSLARMEHCLRLHHVVIVRRVAGSRCGERVIPRRLQVKQVDLGVCVGRQSLVSEIPKYV